MTAIWLDDERDAPRDAWHVARTPFEFQELVKKAVETGSDLTAIAFDFWLGAGCDTGADCMRWLFAYAAENDVDLTNTRMSLHSSSRDGQQALRDVYHAHIDQTRHSKTMRSSEAP